MPNTFTVDMAARLLPVSLGHGCGQVCMLLGLTHDVCTHLQRVPAWKRLTLHLMLVLGSKKVVLSSSPSCRCCPWHPCTCHLLRSFWHLASRSQSRVPCRACPAISPHQTKACPSKCLTQQLGPSSPHATLQTNRTGMQLQLPVNLLFADCMCHQCIESGPHYTHCE